MNKIFNDPVCGIPVVVAFSDIKEVASLLKEKFHYTDDIISDSSNFSGECIMQVSDKPEDTFICIWIDSTYYKNHGAVPDSFLADTASHETLHAFLDVCQIIDGSNIVSIDNSLPEHWTYHFGKLFSYVYEVIEAGLKDLKSNGKKKEELESIERRMEEFYSRKIDRFIEMGGVGAMSIMKEKVEDCVRDGLDSWLSSDKSEKHDFWKFYLPAIVHNSKIMSFINSKTFNDSKRCGELLKDKNFQLELEKCLDKEVPFDKNSKIYSKFCTSRSGVEVREELVTDIPGELMISPTANSKPLKKEDIDIINKNIKEVVVDKKLPTLFNPGIEVRGDLILIGGGVDQTNYEKSKNCIITLPLRDVRNYNIGYDVVSKDITEEFTNRLKDEFGWSVVPFNG